MKKIISAGLAAMLAVSALSTAAYAEDQTVIAQGVIAKPAIKVTLPKSMAFVFNPYELTVDAKGKVGEAVTDGAASNPTTLNNTIVVPSYQFDTTTAGKGWCITNNSGKGADLKMAVYAYSTYSDDAAFATLDTTSTKVGAEVKTKRVLKLTVAATPYTDAGEAGSPVNIKVHSKELTVAQGKTMLDYAKGAGVLDGDGSSDTQMPASLVQGIKGVMTVDSKEVPGVCYISMTGTIQNKGALTWAETDTPAVTFVYSFDFDGGATT